MYVIFYRKEDGTKDWMLANSEAECEEFAKKNNIWDYDIALDMLNVDSLTYKITTMQNKLEQLKKICEVQRGDIMAKYIAVLESSYYGCDEEYEFEMPDDATKEKSKTSECG